MVYRRRNFRRRYRGRGRRTVRRAVRRVMRKKQRQGIGNFKLRGSDAVSSGSDNIINWKYSTSNPNAFVNKNNTGFTGPLQDWTNFVALYDNYRVCGIQLRWVPHKPNDTSTTTNYRPMYIVMDPTDTIQPSTVGQFIQYERCIIKNLYRPWKLYFKIPKTNAGTSDLGYGWAPTGSPVSNGAIHLYSDDLDLQDNYGDIIATYYIQGKMRK